MPRQVSEHVQELVGIIRPIEQNHCTQGHRALALALELDAARNGASGSQMAYQYALNGGGWSALAGFQTEPDPSDAGNDLGSDVNNAAAETKES